MDSENKKIRLAETGGTESVNIRDTPWVLLYLVTSHGTYDLYIRYEEIKDT